MQQISRRNAIATLLGLLGGSIAACQLVRNERKELPAPGARPAEDPDEYVLAIDIPIRDVRIDGGAVYWVKQFDHDGYKGEIRSNNTFIQKEDRIIANFTRKPEPRLEVWRKRRLMYIIADDPLNYPALAQLTPVSVMSNWDPTGTEGFTVEFYER